MLRWLFIILVIGGGLFTYFKGNPVTYLKNHFQNPQKNYVGKSIAHRNENIEKVIRESLN